MKSMKELLKIMEGSNVLGDPSILVEAHPHAWPDNQGSSLDINIMYTMSEALGVNKLTPGGTPDYYTYSGPRINAEALVDSNSGIYWQHENGPSGFDQMNADNNENYDYVMVYLNDGGMDDDDNPVPSEFAVAIDRDSNTVIVGSL